MTLPSGASPCIDPVHPHCSMVKRVDDLVAVRLRLLVRRLDVIGVPEITESSGEVASPETSLKARPESGEV